MKQRHAQILAIGLPTGLAIGGAIATGDGLRTWYPALRKSRLVIPLWAFAPAALLYSIICGRLLYRLLLLDRDTPDRTAALLLLGSMMGANEGWNYLFLGRRSVRAGLFGMIGYTLLTIRLYRLLRRRDPQAAHILRPYVGWLGYDLVYAFELWRLNRG
ncbi:MAG TPA: TspO/MBR family protein [Herpetosiphonaceae bacterium]|nr:TspO/MBR family protein [Herpetosiphonaceae bacterium]